MSSLGEASALLLPGRPAEGKELPGSVLGATIAPAQAANARNLDGKWVLTLKNTTQQPALQSLTNRETREKLFEASWTRASRGDANDTRDTIRRLATIRAEKGRLLGSPHYAAWALEDQMAKTPGQVRTFLSFKFPLYGANGELYGLCGIATDITERKRTQDALTQAALAVSSAQGASVLQELVRLLATILEADGALIAGPHEDSQPGHMRMHAFYLDGNIEANFDYDACGTPCEKVVGQTFRIYPARVREHFPGDPTFEKLECCSVALLLNETFSSF